MRDVDCVSFEQKMLFWQSVVVDKSEHSGDRRLAKDVCHEKCNVMSVHQHHVRPSDTSATATTTATTTTNTTTNDNKHNNDIKRQIEDTYVVISPMLPTNSDLEGSSIPIDLIDPTSFPTLMSTRDVDNDKRQQTVNN